jgi:hypothetical protein
MRHNRTIHMKGLFLAAGLAAGLLGSLPAEATLIVGVQSVTAGANTNNDTLDVTLMNTGPSAVAVGGFTFEIISASSNISFIDANTSTAAPYVFDGNSAFGPDLTGPTSGPTLSTSDVDLLGSATVASGATVGLGHITFDVAAAASGIIAITLGPTPQFTSVADASGNNLPITLANGQVTISTVPEPSLVLPLAMAAVIGARRLRRRALRPAHTL